MKDVASLAFAIFLFFVGSLAFELSGCKQLLSATELLARKVQCALAHRHLPNEQILLECAVDPADAKNILDIVGQERDHDARLMRVGACGGDAGAR